MEISSASRGKTPRSAANSRRELVVTGRETIGARGRVHRIRWKSLWVRAPTSIFSALARGGVTVDKLASARSPSAAPAPATRAALIGRPG